MRSRSGRRRQARPRWCTTPTTVVCSAEGGFLPAPELESLEAWIGYRFAERRRLLQALTHTSRAHELGDLESGNERLEFLGDAVLGMIVADELMRGYPDADEGVLSKARAAAVNKQALARRARSLELGRHLQLGRGEQRSGGADKDSILANVFEALIGAIYLDGGIEPARGFVVRELGPGLSDSDAALGDAKTQLQEQVQALGLAPPRYRIVAESGPAHARRFEVEVCVDGEVLARGRGTSKQAAEQDAAHGALPVVRERSA